MHAELVGLNKSSPMIPFFHSVQLTEGRPPGQRTVEPCSFQTKKKGEERRGETCDIDKQGLRLGVINRCEVKEKEGKGEAGPATMTSRAWVEG